MTAPAMIASATSRCIATSAAAAWVGPAPLRIRRRGLGDGLELPEGMGTAQLVLDAGEVS